MKKRRLGRGLDALLGDSPSAVSNPPEDTPRSESLQQLPVELLDRGRYQPRSHMNQEALEELAKSIAAQGVVQPIVVRPVDDTRYEIVAGERRWRAAQIAGLETVPVIVREVPDNAALAIALIENIQREDLNPIEEAQGLQRLLDEFGLTHEQVAEGIGRSRSAVSNLLRLLNLSPAVRAFLEQGQLEMGHARALLTLEAEAQDKLAKRVVDGRLSVRQTEAMVRAATGKPNTPAAASEADPDITRLQENLSERLGAKVSIIDRSGKGRLVIEYHSLDELDGILTRIN